MEKSEVQENACAALGTVTLGGKTYLVGQPTPQDMMSVAKFLRRRAALQTPLQRVVSDPFLRELPPDLREQAIRAAVELQAGGGADLTKQGATDALHSVEGCRFLAWLLIRKNHAEVTLETFAPLIGEDNLDQVFVELSEASGMDSLGNSAGRPGSKKKV